MGLRLYEHSPSPSISERCREGEAAGASGTRAVAEYDSSLPDPIRRILERIARSQG